MRLDASSLLRDLATLFFSFCNIIMGRNAIVEKECCYCIHFKGLGSSDGVKVGGIGVVICCEDKKDSPKFRVIKPLEDANSGMSETGFEAMALIEGLEEAFRRGLKKVTYLCNDYMLYRYVTGAAKPRQSNIASLVEWVTLLEKQFTKCGRSIAGPNHYNIALPLATAATNGGHIKRVKLNSRRAKAQKMTCKICFEETDINYTFAVNVCLHRYCFSCMKRHVEQKFLKGMTAECPHDGCKSKLNAENCEKFLEPEAIEVMKERMMEASLPPADKLYCPYPRCSTLMSKSSLMRKKICHRPDQSGARICIKCLRLLCIDCKVPWHKNVTCNDYQRLNPDPFDEQSLRYLATRKHWRQCTLCNNMIELAGGCFHITCTCGYQFCYTCGAEWVNGRATCNCLLWEERNIIDGW